MLELAGTDSWKTIGHVCVLKEQFKNTKDLITSVVAFSEMQDIINIC